MGASNPVVKNKKISKKTRKSSTRDSELLFRNKIESVVKVKDLQGFTKEMHDLVQEFHIKVEELGNRFGVSVVDHVSFEISDK